MLSGLYAKARLREPSTWQSIGWFLAMLAWSDLPSAVARGVLMIAGGSCTLVGAFLPDVPKR